MEFSINSHLQVAINNRDKNKYHSLSLFSIPDELAWARLEELAESIGRRMTFRTAEWKNR